GAVYLATDARLGDAPVALKEMTLQHAPGDTAAWARAVDEFRREAALLARLSHPNLPRVIDQFEWEGQQFLVMEYVEGHTLRKELEQRNEPVPIETAMAWFEQLASVLGYLHSQDPPIIYRDLKPTNVMIRPDGRIALIDFGIARLYKPGQSADTAVYGTPGYAPPEQYGVGQTDARSDVFSLAMLFHEMLTRFDPTRRTTARPPLANTLRAEVPEALAQSIHVALASDSEDRFASISAFREAVGKAVVPTTAELEKDPPPEGRRISRLQAGLLGAVAVLGTLLALALFALNRRDPGADATPTAPLAAQATATVVQATARPATPTPLIGPAPPGMAAIGGFTFILGSDEGQPDERPPGRAYVPPFYLERTEVTVAAYRRCVAAGQCTPPADLAALTHPGYYNDPAFERFPVINVTWDQARAYCSAQGWRLPTELEWESAAKGAQNRRYPWGDEWDPARLNTWGSGQGGDVVAVGSFPSGATPEGLLDMAGNVAEWTSSLDQPYPYNPGDGREVPTQYGSRVIRGNFSGSDPASARNADRERRPPTEFSNSLGFRCATSDSYLPAGMDLIPGGTWVLGSTEEEAAELSYRPGWSALLNEQPAEPITTTAFYLDRTEVTNLAYAEFISATGHPLPRNSFDPDGLAVWNPDGSIPVTRTDHPVVNVTWADAAAFCQWAGKRLPSEPEWERAARGDGRRIWPWGDEWDPARANTKERGLGTTEPVGAAPGGAGPYGTLDLAGNA
ncbi:MAG TPA: bifunctional serine/threonine-protein kinase/formylglycine-generating enzyme family protein, partial [Herpetosiphonaceae bacterium]|nr:bifunctional serine/threonine-protein kinase/formylglycine-generating enzyme family protein [Herpetosiphonaceae bacterium]